MTDERHEMHLVFRDKDGYEFWVCDVCGRRLILNHDPYQKSVVTEGDPVAIHEGHYTESDLELHAEVTFSEPDVPEAEPEPEDDRWLEPFREWATRRGGTL